MNIRSLYIVGLLVVIFSCERKSETVYKDYVGPLSQVKDLDATLRDENKTVIRIKAPTQLEFKTKDMEFPDGLYVEFYDSEGNLSTTLTSKRAKFNKGQNKWTLNDSVTLNNVHKRETLITQELIYDRKNKRIFTAKRVRIITPEFNIVGIGLESDEQFDKYKLHSVTGKKYIKN